MLLLLGLLARYLLALAPAVLAQAARSLCWLALPRVEQVVIWHCLRATPRTVVRCDSMVVLARVHHQLVLQLLVAVRVVPILLVAPQRSQQVTVTARQAVL